MLNGGSIPFAGRGEHDTSSDPIGAVEAPLDPILPEVLKIGCKTYVIEPMSACDSLANNRLGECDSHNSVIRICGDQKPHDVAHILLHEVFHALWYTSGVVEGDSEERVVTLMSAAMAQTLRDNPDLLTYLAEIYAP